MKQKLKAKKKYKAREGSPFMKEEAQLIGEELERLKNTKGYLTSKMVLKEAKDKNSKLHKYFEWNTNEAAKKWLMQQARALIQHIVEVVVINDKPVEQRSFLSVAHKDVGHVYVTIEEATTNSDYRKQLLDRMISVQENLLSTMQMFRSEL